MILEWLAGRTLPGAATALKKMQILFPHQPDERARHARSLCRWLPMSGYAGLPWCSTSGLTSTRS